MSEKSKKQQQPELQPGETFEVIGKGPEEPAQVEVLWPGGGHRFISIAVQGQAGAPLIAIGMACGCPIDPVLIKVDLDSAEKMAQAILAAVENARTKPVRLVKEPKPATVPGVFHA